MIQLFPASVLNLSRCTLSKVDSTTPVSEPEVGFYDVVILAVAHDKFFDQGLEYIHSLGNKSHLFCDLSCTWFRYFQHSHFNLSLVAGVDDQTVEISNQLIELNCSSFVHS